MAIHKPTQGRGFFWGIMLMVFVGVLTAVPLGMGIKAGQANPIFLGIMGVTLGLVLLMTGYFTWAAHNMEYQLNENNLVIKWAFNSKKVPLANIKGVRRASGLSSLKVAGASWPGFHIGSFTDPGGKGSVNMFGTRLWGDIILIRTKWEIIGVTPEDPEAFLEELENLVPALELDSPSSRQQLETFSPWKDKKLAGLAFLAILILAGTGFYLVTTIPQLPNQIPLHFNFAGEVDRYGSPKEILIPFGIGIGIYLLLLFVNGITGRNNKTSAYLLAFVSLFVALLFSAISIAMVISSM